ncbi:MAG: hypothetical protein O2866_03880 [archaeon]|nr:hypothetical protein [archaeon]MDA0842453.1 hypothetical protein [archaeon]MDA1168002.1 hypothetical protein [archaeon]
MKSFFHIEPLKSMKDWFENLASHITKAESIRIIVPATLEGILSTVPLEAAFLDTKKSFSRRFVPSKVHQSPDEHRIKVPNFKGLSIVLDVESEHIRVENIEFDDTLVYLQPLEIEVEFKRSEKHRISSLDVVFLASLLASLIAPNGKKTRAIRPMSGLGLWSRSVMDNTIDPMYTLVRNHLQEEGSLRVVPLPEVHHPVLEMIPELSPRMLKRLSERWEHMNYEERCESLSEFALVGIGNEQISTARFEELIWHRVLIGESEIDAASSIFKLKRSWPSDQKSATLLASKYADELLLSNKLPNL